MDRLAIRERCIAKLLEHCTSKENAIEMYDDFVRRITESAWHLLNLSTRDEVMTTTIMNAMKDDVTNIVLHNWAEGEYNHFPNDSDVAHAIGATLFIQYYAKGGGRDVYEKTSY